MSNKYRSPYKQFTLVKYYYSDKDNRAVFVYRFDEALEFRESLVFPSSVKLGSSKQFDQALRLYFLLASVSYYKAYPTYKISIKPFKLDNWQAKFINQYYLEGLGEFLYVNNLNPSIITRFKASKKYQKTAIKMKLQSGLLPIGGGKDSIVSAEVLNELKIDYTPYRVNTLDWLDRQMNTMKTGGIRIARHIDPLLLAHNKTGALNGHIPVTGIISASAVLTALAQGKRDIILSNESSANIPNTEYGGLSINHQYSKSFAFEKQFAKYIKRYIASNMRYFSLLRPFSELNITKHFAQNYWSRYRHSWSSSNHNFRMKRTVLSWDKTSPKTLSVFAMMAPYTDRNELIKEFGFNPFRDIKLRPVWKQLLGQKKHKPFECVADIPEMNEAIRLAYRSGNWPELKSYKISSKAYNFQRLSKHILPREYKGIIKLFKV